MTVGTHPPLERPLAQHHRRVLEEGSAILREVIQQRGYWTAERWQDLEELVPPFRGTQKAPEQFPCLVIPQHGPDGEYTYSVLRPDCPRVDRKGKMAKYVQPAGAGVRLDVPLCCLAGLREAERPLWITEGARKADALASVGLVAMNTPGVDAWRSPSVIPDLFGIPFKERAVVIAYDSDAMTKPAVWQAVIALARWLQQKGAAVEVLDWRRANPSVSADVGGR
jgi:putative DNA primase/helicase